MLYLIDPVAKPRMTRKDKRPPFRRCVEKYHAFADLCRAKKVDLPMEGAKVVFYIKMPKSWSKKKKADHAGKPHLSKPDLSNLLKAVEDACYLDDSEIWCYSGLEKRWAYQGAIQIIPKEK